jgi:hypothetical protein
MTSTQSRTPLPSAANISEFGPVHGFGLARERYAVEVANWTKAPAVPPAPAEDYLFSGGMGLARVSR